MPRKSTLYPTPGAPDTPAHLFNPSDFTAINAEDTQAIAQIKASLIDFYQPLNSEELFAIERIAVARHSLLRTYRIESGLVSFGLQKALQVPGDPQILRDSEPGEGFVHVTQQQKSTFWTAAGFDQLCRSQDWQMFLRYQAQAERLYRRAVEAFDRLRAYRRPAPEQTTVEPETRPQPDPELPIPAPPAVIVPSPVRPNGRQVQVHRNRRPTFVFPLPSRQTTEARSLSPP